MIIDFENVAVRERKRVDQKEGNDMPFTFIFNKFSLY